VRETKEEERRGRERQKPGDENAQRRAFAISKRVDALDMTEEGNQRRREGGRRREKRMGG